VKEAGSTVGDFFFNAFAIAPLRNGATAERVVQNKQYF
jgi:hypothetical protein